MKTKEKRRKIIAKTNSVFMVMCLLALWLAILATWPVPVAWAEEKHVIAIGFLPHFTGSYAETESGYASAKDDTLKWASEVNLIPGVELKCVWADGGSDQAKTLAAFKQIVAHKPRPVVIIAAHSGFGAAMKKLYEREKVPHLEAAYNDALVQPPSWSFCEGPSWAGQSAAWIDYFLKHIWKKKEPPKLAWLLADVGYGRASLTDEVKAWTKSKGIETVAIEFVPQVATATTMPQVMRIKDSGADFIAAGMHPHTVLVVLKDMEKLGILGKIPMGLTYACDIGVLIKVAGPLANGIYRTDVRPLPDEWKQKCPFVYEAYEKNKRDPDKGANKWIYSDYWTHFAVATEAIKMAIQDVGVDKVDGQAVLNALTRVKNFDAWGTSPPITYSETDRAGVKAIIMQKIESGKPISLGNFPLPDVNPGGKDLPK